MHVDSSPSSELRADARRNRERILSAAHAAFIEQGASVPLEEVAARAGVGIATLYRRFPDRQALQQAVAHDALTQIAAELQAAINEEPDAFQALTRYLRRALDLQVSAVIPELLDVVDLDTADLQAIRADSAARLQHLIEQAIADGSLRADVAFGDVALVLVRLSRPLPGSIDRVTDLELAHRQLAIVIDGLRARPDAELLPGPPLTLDALRALPRATSAR